MTHAAHVAELERAVVERVKRERKAQRAAEWPAPDQPLADLADALIAAEAETCPTCGGTGEILPNVFAERADAVPCPSDCERGRKVGA